ncbi:hypothetical protein ACOMHN_061475 [Nucella lapillus]
MAVNGPPNHDDTYLDSSLASDSPYSPIMETSSPESSNPSPVPVSPGKKRVRISDSTSIRVIEKRGDPRKFRIKDKQNNNGFKARALQFSNESDRSEKEALLGDPWEYGEEYLPDEEYRRECSRSPEEYLEYTEMLCTEDQVAYFSPDVLTRTER